MNIEFKGCGKLLRLDGQLTPEGEAFMKRQQSSVEFKVVNPPDSAHVSAMHQRASDIQRSIDAMKRQSHVEPTHPVVVRGLRLLQRRAHPWRCQSNMKPSVSSTASAAC